VDHAPVQRLLAVGVYDGHLVEAYGLDRERQLGVSLGRVVAGARRLFELLAREARPVSGLDGQLLLLGLAPPLEGLMLFPLKNMPPFFFISSSKRCCGRELYLSSEQEDTLSSA
jgi:hypothetical protein